MTDRTAPALSCLSLERPGTWRTVGLVVLLCAVFLPDAPLLWEVVSGHTAHSVGARFGVALGTSMMLAGATMVVAFCVGLPLGVLSALCEFRGRRLLLALVTLPLLIPSFLWAIGWSSIAARLGSTATQVLSGVSGCLLVSIAATVPLVLLTAYASTVALSESQVAAARLAGGERTLLLHACRHGAAAALLAATLGGLLTLTDPGPGQIFGVRTAAAEILTSFGALYDFALAARQCLVLALVVLVVAVPLAWCAAPRLARGLLAKQSRRAMRRAHPELGVVVTAALAVVTAGGTLVPILGLIWPLIAGSGGSTPGGLRVVQQAAQNGHMPLVLLAAAGAATRTAANTVIYAVGAGTVAAAMGLLLALCVGRDARLRAVAVGACLAVFCLPPAFGALGIVQLATNAPAWADPVLRSHVTVCLGLGLRFVPVAAVIALQAWGSTSPSWALAADVHGVPLATYLRRVLLPLLLPAIGVAMLLVALLATADVGTVLLLHPAGQASLPLAIFTVMANAPESLVAALCLIYVASAGGLLGAIWVLVRVWQR